MDGKTWCPGIWYNGYGIVGEFNKAVFPTPITRIPNSHSHRMNVKEALNKILQPNNSLVVKISVFGNR